MEVPQVVIAQAEAAASQDQTGDGAPLSPTATNRHAQALETTIHMLSHELILLFAL